MPTMNMIQAIRSGLEVMLERDPNVCVFGEDVGYFGGVFRATQGLQQRFGPQRVFDTPLAEGGIIGVAIGMGINGLRPVPEIQFSDYMYPAFDQITNELAKLRYRSGGEWTAPLTIRAPSGGGIRGGLFHSQSPEAYYTHTAGLCVVMPSNPHDAKGLLDQQHRERRPGDFLRAEAAVSRPVRRRSGTRAAVARSAGGRGAGRILSHAARPGGRSCGRARK